MKLKTLLILTLFISFNYSVHSEGKKDRVAYKLFDEINSLLKENSNTSHELWEIINELNDAPSIDNKNKDTILRIKNSRKWIEKTTSLLNHLKTIIHYEKIFHDEKSCNASVIVQHLKIRTAKFEAVYKFINSSVKYLKEHKVQIQNVSAVIAINNNLESIEKIKSWLEKNIKFDFKEFDIKLVGEFKQPELKK
jgi:hypothetical protein